MKIAAAQISCSLGDPETNLLKVRDFSRRAKETGAELIVFPEMIDTGYWMPVIRAHANHWNSGFVPRLRETARELSIARLLFDGRDRIQVSLAIFRRVVAMRIDQNLGIVNR